MPKGKISDVQTDTEATQQKFPTPMLSSASASWESIVVEHWQLPPHEIPAQTPLDYIIKLHFQRPARVEFTWDGQLLSKRFTYGEVTIVPPGLLCSGVCFDACDFLVIRLKEAFVNRIARELSLTDIEIAPRLGVVNPQIQYIGLGLKAELESGCLSGHLYGESLATALSSHLLQQHSTSSGAQLNFTGGLPKYKLSRVLEYINDNLERDLTLTELKSVVQMSTYHFARLFKQSTGVTPHFYVMNCRIERAKTLLAQKELSIAEICSKLGFRSPSHFSALFRKFTTVTPKAYRENL